MDKLGERVRVTHPDEPAEQLEIDFPLQTKPAALGDELAQRGRMHRVNLQTVKMILPCYFPECAKRPMDFGQVLIRSRSNRSSRGWILPLMICS
jgi:hypothetical protein